MIKIHDCKNYADYLLLTLHSKLPYRGLGQTWVEPALDGKQQISECVIITYYYIFRGPKTDHP